MEFLRSMSVKFECNPCFQFHNNIFFIRTVAMNVAVEITKYREQIIIILTKTNWILVQNECSRISLKRNILILKVETVMKWEVIWIKLFLTVEKYDWTNYRLIFSLYIVSNYILFDTSKLIYIFYCKWKSATKFACHLVKALKTLK